jgi:hypothetical protein
MKSPKYNLWLYLFLIIILAGATAVADSNALLTDIDILYIYDQSSRLDWPLIHYLAIENGCHIALATVRSGPIYKQILLSSEKYNLSGSKFFVPDTTAVYRDSIIAALWGEYPPDMVFFSGKFESPELAAVADSLLNIPFDSSRIFGAKKYFRRVEQKDGWNAWFNARQYMDEYHREIILMARSIAEPPPDRSSIESYTSYSLIKAEKESYLKSPSFLFGIEKLKFDRIIEKNIESALRQSVFKRQRENYVTHLKKAILQQGQDKIESLLEAMTELKKIRQSYYYQLGRVDSTALLAKYIEKTSASLQAAIFLEAGIDYNGAVVIRDTPEGRRLKFNSTINNDGSLNLKAGWVELKAPWAESTIVIDSVWTDVGPNNSLVRQYTIDVDAEKLKSISNQSLEFIGRVRYSGTEVEFTYQAGVYEASSLTVEFIPDFLMVKPFDGLNIDRLVEPTSLKAMIKKPSDYSGKVQVDIDAPPGILAGAFRTELNLEKGQRAMEIEIPLVVTKSIGDRIQRLTLRILKDGQLLASSVAMIRAIKFEIPHRAKLALLPDRTGLLEDILIETGADYRTISERFLSTGNFDHYDAVIFGTECFKNYQELEIVRDKIKQYLDYGGTVVVFGQPDSWRDDLLPVSIISYPARLSKTDIEIRQKDHALFKAKYKLNPADFIDGITGDYTSYPAVVFPGKRIVSFGKTSLLSVSHFGNGRFIYCGLPLLQMIKELDPQAARLFSNLMYYINK